MTRKDYVALAGAVAMAAKIWRDPMGRDPSHDEQVALSVLKLIAHNIANTLAQDNPRFDRARFLKACGVAS